MEDLFCNYNQAVALKELGFNEPCLLEQYVEDGKQVTEWAWGEPFKTNQDLNEHVDELNENSDDEHFEYSVTIPLNSQVFKWFRDTYKIQGFIKSYTVRGGNGSQNFCDYIYVINGIGMNVIQTDARDGQFKTYEQAESACIDKLISIVKEKKS